MCAMDADMAGIPTIGDAASPMMATGMAGGDPTITGTIHVTTTAVILGGTNIAEKIIAAGMTGAVMTEAEFAR